MKVAAQRTIVAPRAAVWEWISDPQQYLRFMAGVTRWEVCSEHDQGIGARYRMLMRVGSAEVGGLIEVVEFDEPAQLAWTSVTGLDQRGRWRIEELSENRCRVELRLRYGVAGSGIGGWLAEHVSAPIVTGNLRVSLRTLERLLEHERSRRDGEARRAAVAS